MTHGRREHCTHAGHERDPFVRGHASTIVARYNITHDTCGPPPTSARSCRCGPVPSLSPRRCAVVPSPHTVVRAHYRGHQQRSADAVAQSRVHRCRLQHLQHHAHAHVNECGQHSRDAPRFHTVGAAAAARRRRRGRCTSSDACTVSLSRHTAATTGTSVVNHSAATLSPAPR